MTIEVYARSIDRRWRRMLRDSDATVWVFSPYLTSPTANSVLSHVKPTSCEIHTVCSIESFVSGASSVRTLRQLLNRGFRLFHIDDLHAKVVIVSGSQATIGSQNVTSRGVTNLEASVAIMDVDRVAELERMVQRWIESRRPITSGELSDIERHVKPLRRKFLALRCQMQDATKATAVSREAREREAREREAHEHRVRTRQRAIDSTLGSLSRMSLNGEVPLEIARDLVRRSAWWRTHRHGPQRAGGHADRIEGAADDLRLRFGANQFLVSRAIRRCVDHASRFVATLSEGRHSDRGQLWSALRGAVAGAVANSSGVEYQGLYPLHGSEMHFGSQAIDVDDFVGAFLQRSGVNALLAELERLDDGVRT